MRVLFFLALLAATPVVLMLCLLFWLVGVLGVLFGTHDVHFNDGTVTLDLK